MTSTASISNPTSQSPSPGPPPPTALPPLPSHPYRVYAPATYAPTILPSSRSYHHSTRGQHANTVDPAVAYVTNKPAHMTVQQTYFVHHHHHHHHPTPSQNTAQSTHPWGFGQPLSPKTSGTIRKYRSLIWFLLFLPIPPLLSIIYLLVGHRILRHTFRNTTHSSLWSPSLRSSANAAATGGIILAVPLFLLFFLLIYSSIQPTRPTRSVPADFFEDDGGSAKTSMALFAVYTACGALILCVGAAAGPLGVACLSQNGRREMLSPRKAAEAGIFGGAVVLGSLLAGAAIGLSVWMIWTKSQDDLRDNKE